MTDLPTTLRRTPSVRIDTFRNQIAGFTQLLEFTVENLADLHALANDRYRAGQFRERVSGGDPTAVGIDLDTHGDPRARELWQRLALRVMDNAHDMSEVLHEIAGYLNTGTISTRRDPTADAPTAEIIEALAAQRRRRQRGETSPEPLVDQPRVTEPASVGQELEHLRNAVRKVRTQITSSDRLTPAEHDALRRAVDPTFTRSKKRNSKKRR